MRSRSELIYVLLLTIAFGFALRAFRINFQSLWTDELLTYLNANDTLMTVLVNSQDVNIPPLYYLIINPLLKLHDHLSILRIPSLIFGSLSILLFYLILAYWFGRMTGLLGAFLMAISPFHVWYSQEARPYALLLLLSLVSVCFFQQSLKNKSNAWWKAAFVISTTATVYCHTVTAAFVALLVTYVAIAIPRQQWREWLVAFGSVALLITPVVYRLLVVPPVGSANSFHSSKPFAAIAYTVWAFGTGYSLGPNLAELHVPNRLTILWSYLPVILPVMLVLSSLLLLSIIQLKKSRETFLFTVLWLVSPLGFAILGSIFTVHPFNVRYAILSYPPFIALLASGLVGIKLSWLRNIMIGSLIFISLVSLRNYYFNERYHREDNRSAAQFLEAHTVPGDLVIVSAAYTAQNVKYYYQGPPLVFIGYPTHTILEENAALESNPLGAFFVKPDRTAFDLEPIIAGRNRFWLFLSRTFHSDPYGTIRNFLDDKYSQQLSASWAGTELILYETRTASRAAQ